jgi:Bardet-Biedl syndrome 9 protein
LPVSWAGSASYRLCGGSASHVICRPTATRCAAQDKAPAPLNQLDFLMEETYGSIMETGTVVEAAQVGVTAACRG